MSSTQVTDTLEVSDAESAFHIYMIEWTLKKMCGSWMIVKNETFSNAHDSYKKWPLLTVSPCPQHS
ncbi:MAG: hypothetical protein PVH63_06320 [Balneolaceae bacterium]